MSCYTNYGSAKFLDLRTPGSTRVTWWDAAELTIDRAHDAHYATYTARTPLVYETRVGFASMSEFTAFRHEQGRLRSLDGYPCVMAMHGPPTVYQGGSLIIECVATFTRVGGVT
jgi:hypothetical protein